MITRGKNYLDEMCMMISSGMKPDMKKGVLIKLQRQKCQRKQRCQRSSLSGHTVCYVVMHNQA